LSHKWPRGRTTSKDSGIDKGIGLFLAALRDSLVFPIPSRDYAPFPSNLVKFQGTHYTVVIGTNGTRSRSLHRNGVAALDDFDIATSDCVNI
jgi:hypothetical protein